MCSSMLIRSCVLRGDKRVKPQKVNYLAYTIPRKFEFTIIMFTLIRALSLLLFILMARDWARCNSPNKTK
eukprot:snap_masked-scaffold_51-processed-gene-1.27-mRNA-1 protein AED:1.00 eAED:1.00 QI:0/0/0/0/1/1/2/0/69